MKLQLLLKRWEAQRNGLVGRPVRSLLALRGCILCVCFLKGLSLCMYRKRNLKAFKCCYIYIHTPLMRYLLEFFVLQIFYYLCRKSLYIDISLKLVNGGLMPNNNCKSYLTKNSRSLLLFSVHWLISFTNFIDLKHTYNC